MGKVIHFDMSADDPERAIKFYSEVFGWKFKAMETPEPTEEMKAKMKEMFGDLSQEDMDYWLIEGGPEDAPGINGGLSRRRKPLADGGHDAFICTIDVDDIDEAAKKVENAGGKILMPKMAITGVGWHIQFEDTEKNVVQMLQADEQAKF